MREEYLNPEQMKRLAIGAVTSALNARQIEDPQGRIDQFASDYKMLLADINGTDLYRLASLLADLSGSLVEQMAALLQVDPPKVMQYLAQQMLDVPITEVDGDDPDANGHEVL